jgi:PII-like signaling protein
MLAAGAGKRMIITINEADRWHGRSAYQALLDMLQHRGLAGATVTRAMAGFTGSGPIRTMHLIDASLPLPVRIEVVDTAEAIERVLPDVYDIVEFGLVEIQDTQIVKFASEQPVGAEAPRKEDLVRLVGKAKMLRVHIGENDKWEGEPLYETIVKRARQLDIAGATVYRGILGYGAQKRIHKHHTLTLSSDDPIMVSVIDEAEKIDRLLGALDSVVKGGCLITISDVTVVRYTEHREEAPEVSERASGAEP